MIFFSQINVLIIYSQSNLYAVPIFIWNTGDRPVRFQINIIWLLRFFFSYLYDIRIGI